ncbi:holo-ACP synthase [Halalkalibacter urbisdiaboli]|uniref:holo-ACP synthase n=1 Tax=Halalkalibacter urbisdiaboli TaxID=1960589 RepID=UPI000B42E7C1|nr:holo-ACP synthase [Halalkalibacter urbisdiaboli]
MIIGIGIDLVELRRIETLVERQGRFVDRVLTVNEKAKYETLSKGRQVEYLAGRFAAKEAFVKAVGTGISKSFSWHDIEILNETSGKPILYAATDCEIHLSISHSDSYAVAQVILERLSS